MSNGRGGRPTRTHLLPPHPGNTYRPFKELIQVERIDDRTFRSIAPPFTPGGPVGVGRAYGAHVYMQAAWAACQTVTAGFLLHHVSGNFTLSGRLDVPFVYKVHTIRNGKSYCTRIVNVTQSQYEGICFTCICSFKKPEPEQIEAQHDLDIWSEYKSVLDGKRPTDFPECPSMDVPFYRQRWKETGINDDFPGLECRRVDMAAYNQDKHPLDRRQLIFYRTIGDMPEDPNMHLCAHLYASDRNSLYVVANAFEISDDFTAAGSLAHTVTFHSSAESLFFGPSGPRRHSPLDDAQGRWFCMEAYGSRISSGRLLFNARFWNGDGTHILTAMQDGLLRFTRSLKPTAEEQKAMDHTNARWKGKGGLGKL